MNNKLLEAIKLSVDDFFEKERHILKHAIESELNELIEEVRPDALIMNPNPSVSDKKMNLIIDLYKREILKKFEELQRTIN